MPDVKIKGYSGNELHYADVPKVWLAAEESTEDNPVLVPFTYGEAMDDVEIIPDFSDGDMRVTTPDGYLVRSGVVKKPGSLVPGNIKKGETVAGIPGEYEGEKIELETVTVDLAMANGDQIIEPSEGKALSKVTVTKPETLVPENIAEGVDIAGIIGTLAAGGGNVKIEVVELKSDSVVTGANKMAHNLGAIPDIIVMKRLSAQYKSCINFAFGFSKAFSELTGKALVSCVEYRSSSNQTTPVIKQSTSGFDEITSAIGFHSVTNTEFSIGTGTYYLTNQFSHTFLLISGLT